MRLGLFQPAGPDRINVTPMIDVVMCLIVFDLIVGHLAEERRAAVRVPVASENTPDTDDDTTLVVTVQRDGTIDLDGEPASAEDLGERLAAGGVRGGMTVRVRADRELPYSSVAPVIDACRSAGVRIIELATERGS